MSEIEQDSSLPVVDELTTLKFRADQLGIPYHPSIGVDKLRTKIADRIEGRPDADAAPVAAPVLEKPARGTETEMQRVRRLKMEANELVRINVTCMNPSKREWLGEIFTVGNSVVGMHRKYVPFNTTDGWHVPRIIYEFMKARECQIFVKKKAANGNTFNEGKLIKEFAIDVLPKLTQQELDELARRQAMAAGKDEG